MSQPLHHSFILRPVNAPTTGYVVCDDNKRRRQVIPPEQQQPQPRPHLTLLRNKTLTSPPQWSRRRHCPKPTQLFSDYSLRHEFLPPTSPTYWKERCQRFQSLCQSSRKRLREMEEDQRQLRRRIHCLEERLTTTSGQKKTPRSVTPLPVPSTIVADPQLHTRECFYLADCEGMSDSEYGEHYYCTFEDEEEESEEEENKPKEEQGEKKEEEPSKSEDRNTEVVEQRDDTE